MQYHIPVPFHANETCALGDKVMEAVDPLYEEVGPPVSFVIGCQRYVGEYDSNGEGLSSERLCLVISTWTSADCRLGD